MQAGQRLSRHLSRETKAADLEEKIQHIEKFGPVLVDTLVRITKSPDKRKTAAYEGLKKILGRDTDEAQTKLASAETALDEANLARKKRLKAFKDEDSALEALHEPPEEEVKPTEDHPSGETTTEDSAVESQSRKGKKKSKDDILSVFAPEKSSKTAPAKAPKKATDKSTSKKAAEEKSAKAKSAANKK
jgi:DNA topoisomerase-6 subunit B